MLHIVRFERNFKTGEWRFICSCGETYTGKRDDVRERAAVHDLSQEDRDGEDSNRA